MGIGQIGLIIRLLPTLGSKLI